jgi:hypothetical protein
MIPNQHIFAATPFSERSLIRWVGTRWGQYRRGCESCHEADDSG